MKVWLLTIDGENFDGQYLKVFSTEEKAKKHLAEWCRKMWNDINGCKEPLAENDDEAVTKYFLCWENEDYSIEAFEVQ